MTRGPDRTKLRILDAAEKLFAAHGYDGTSMREIAQRAKVQIALGNYHFGSKQGLHRAVFERRIVGIVQDRIARLNEIANRSIPPPEISELFGAMIRPWMDLCRSQEGRAYVQLVARELTDPAEADRGLIEEHLKPLALEFMQALGRLDKSGSNRAHWYLHFLVGALVLMSANPNLVQRLSSTISFRNEDELLDEMMAFFSEALGNGASKRKISAIPQA